MSKHSVQSDSRHEFVVGLVVVVSFIVFSFFVLMVSGVSTVFRAGYHLNVYYDYIHGIGKGSAVKYAGVLAGEITDIDVSPSPASGKSQIRVEVFLSDWVDVRENSSIYVRGSTPLSEPHLEIISYGEDHGKRLVEGDGIQGISPTPIEDLVANAEAIAAELKETVIKINTVLGDPSVTGDIRDTLRNLAAVTGKIDKILAENEDDIGSVIQRFSEVMTELEELMRRLKEGDGTVGRLVGDDELYEELLAFVREIKAHPWRLMKRDGKDKKFLGIF